MSINPMPVLVSMHPWKNQNNEFERCLKSGHWNVLHLQHHALDTYCDTHATSFSVLKISWLVLLSWTTSPLTRHRIPRLWTSGLKTAHYSESQIVTHSLMFFTFTPIFSSDFLTRPHLPFNAPVVTRAGPSGQNVSNVFPRSHCLPFLFICQSRALTSLATVKPAT